MTMDIDGASVTAEEEDVPTCMLSPFALPHVSISPPPQIRPSKPPPPSCLPVITAISQASKCVPSHLLHK